MRGKAAAGGLGQVRWQLLDRDIPHLHADNLGGTTGERGKPHNPKFQYGEIKSQNLWLYKPVGVPVVGEAPGLTEESAGESHRVLERTQTHPPGNQHLKGHNSLVGSKRSDWRVGESQAGEQAALFLLWLLPHIECHNAVKWVGHPGE